MLFVSFFTKINEKFSYEKLLNAIITTELKELRQEHSIVWIDEVDIFLLTPHKRHRNLVTKRIMVLTGYFVKDTWQKTEQM